MLQLTHEQRTARIAAENDADTHERLARRLAVQRYLNERRSRVRAAVAPQTYSGARRPQQQRLNNVCWLSEHIPAYTSKQKSSDTAISSVFGTKIHAVFLDMFSVYLPKKGHRVGTEQQAEQGEEKETCH